MKVVVWVLSGFGIRMYANLGEDGTQVSEDPNAGFSCSSNTVAPLISSWCP